MSVDSKRSTATYQVTGAGNETGFANLEERGSHKLDRIGALRRVCSGEEQLGQDPARAVLTPCVSQELAARQSHNKTLGRLIVGSSPFGGLDKRVCVCVPTDESDR